MLLSAINFKIVDNTVINELATNLFILIVTCIGVGIVFGNLLKLLHIPAILSKYLMTALLLFLVYCYYGFYL